MGIFGSLFGKSSSSNLLEDTNKYKELIRFISFVKKTKPLMGGNYGIFITYEAPRAGEYTSRLYATIGFCDFKEIQFAREYATGVSRAPGNMVHLYYKQICERAALKQQDWPYAIDEYDFARVLCGDFYDYFTLIPDDNNDDIFEFRVAGGTDARNAVLVFNAVMNVLKAQFPELKISKNHATPYSMGIKVEI